MADEHAPRRTFVGRGGGISPPNRFERVHCQEDWEQLPADELPGGVAGEKTRLPTTFLPDAARRLISTNDSPDIPFRHSVNPYRGCEHGCAYCYARPSHETLGLNAGIDFESKILVKYDAAALLRAELCQPSWKGDLIALSGVTDCYQPVERRLRLTRACLEVLREARQPTAIITKNALVARDVDLLADMAAARAVRVYLSVTTLDVPLSLALEPRTSLPALRLRAIGRLAEAGVPVGVMVAPIIPGLNDSEIPAILSAAAEAGAMFAARQLLRLPLAVAPIFEDWLRRERPLEADRVLSRIRQTRGGRLNDPRFGKRMRGEGVYAAHVARTFNVFARKVGLDRPLPDLDRSAFRPPRDEPSGPRQMTLF